MLALGSACECPRATRKTNFFKTISPKKVFAWDASYALELFYEAHPYNGRSIYKVLRSDCETINIDVEDNKAWGYFWCDNTYWSTDSRLPKHFIGEWNYKKKQGGILSIHIKKHFESFPLKFWVNQTFFQFYSWKITDAEDSIKIPTLKYIDLQTGSMVEMMVENKGEKSHLIPLKYLPFEHPSVLKSCFVTQNPILQFNTAEKIVVTSFLDSEDHIPFSRDGTPDCFRKKLQFSRSSSFKK